MCQQECGGKRIGVSAFCEVLIPTDSFAGYCRSVPPKWVTFLIEPGEPKIPALLKDLFIMYSGCPFKGRRGPEGECHDCMCGDPWPACEMRSEFIREMWWEFHMLSAGGQVIEKWREIVKLQRWNSPWSKQYELLWQSPFSNSSALNLPVLLMGGSMRFQGVGSDYEELVVLVRTSWNGDWVFLEWFEK